jgi:DNA-binding MarR family transcriptional regulator
MKIFISWSGETSHAVASTLGDWIPSVIQAVETAVSPEDIRKGTSWANDVSKELDQSSLGILCVVPGNIGASWLNFEAGVLSKSLGVSKVIPLLIDVKKSELDNGPLAQFPSAVFKKDDLYQVLETINRNTEKGKLSKERLRNTFEVWWPKLELDVESIRNPEKPKKPVSAKPALEEIEIEMLKVLYEHPGYGPVTIDAVGYKLDISAQKVKEHLEILERENYVSEHLYVGGQKEFSIAPKGREYLTRHGLVDERPRR